MLTISVNISQPNFSGTIYIFLKYVAPDENQFRRMFDNWLHSLLTRPITYVPFAVHLNLPLQLFLILQVTPRLKKRIPKAQPPNPLFIMLLKEHGLIVFFFFFFDWLRTLRANPFRMTPTLSMMRSTCRFWDPISLCMSMAMWRKFPTMPLTCCRFSSISSSRASFVILYTKCHMIKKKREKKDFLKGWSRCCKTKMIHGMNANIVNSLTSRP